MFFLYYSYNGITSLPSVQLYRLPSLKALFLQGRWYEGKVASLYLLAWVALFFRWHFINTRRIQKLEVRIFSFNAWYISILVTFTYRIFHLIGVMSAEVVVLLNLLNDFDIFKLLTLFYFPIINSICCQHSH